MYNNYDYPAGADTPAAPWNERMPEVRNFEVCVSQTISKTSHVETADFTDGIEEDEMGKHYFIDTEGTDWKRAYANNNHYTPLQLLEEFQHYLEESMADTQMSSGEKIKREHLIRELKGWVDDETVITL